MAAADGGSYGGGVRVRLAFEESCPRSSSSLRRFWFLVKSERQRTIDELSAEIQRRFDVQCGLQLYIDECLLPPWESVAILRENDLISVSEVPKGSEVEKKSHRNEVKEGKFTEDELLANAETDCCRKRKRRKEIRETKETERLSELQMSSKDKQHMNDSRLIETSINEDLSKKSKKWKRKFNADHSDTITLPRSLRESNEYDHMNGNHAIASVCSQVAADSCLVEENIDCHDGSLGHRAVKMKSGNVTISNVAICQVSNIGSTDETRVEEVESEFAVNEAHECVVSGIKPRLTETQKSKKRTRRSKKHNKTNQSSAAIFNNTFLNSANKRVDFVPTNVSDNVSAKSKVIMSTGRTVASANSVGEFANSQHIIFDDEDDGNVTNAGSDSIYAQITGISSSVIKNYSGILTEAIGKEHLTDSNEISGHNGKSRGLPMAVGEAEPIETEIFHDSEFLVAQHLSGPVADESNQPQIIPPLSRGVLPEVSAHMFSKPGVNNFGSASQLLDNKAGRHKPGRPATNTTSPFANVQVFSRRQKKHPATAESAMAAVKSFPMSSMINSSLLPKENDPLVTEVKDYSIFNLLLGPPRAGDHIAYKILQLCADYSPGLSNYKEAEVLGYSPATRAVHLMPLNLPPSDVKRSLGRFDLTVEDENEILTNLTTNNEQTMCNQVARIFSRELHSTNSVAALINLNVTERFVRFLVIYKMIPNWAISLSSRQQFS